MAPPTTAKPLKQQQLHKLQPKLDYSTLGHTLNLATSYRPA
jgi:hypothetical protein